MNIFVLSLEPRMAARMHCDLHVPKMILEATQMLATGMRLRGATDEDFIHAGVVTKAGTPYKSAHPHHPCTKWVAEKASNMYWLSDYAFGLVDEYRSRFGKIHACEEPLNGLNILIREYLVDADFIDAGDITPFAQAMPDEYKDEDAVKAYRRYYHSKVFAKWEKGTPAPDWWRTVEVKA